MCLKESTSKTVDDASHSPTFYRLRTSNSRMAFGRLRRVFEKVKAFGHKVWGGFKQALGVITKSSLIKGVSQAAATAIGGPAAGAAMGVGFSVGEAIADGKTKFTVRKGGLPTWATSARDGG
jgi:hypothetical protein